MCKIFNVNANCIPEQHYMVDISARLAEIKKMVDSGSYFTINRARQYGKTTTLKALSRVLEKEYTVAAIDFQMVSASKFKNENTFSITFAKIFIQAMRLGSPRSASENRGLCLLEQAIQEHRNDIELFELFGYLSEICRYSPKPVVLMIDEVDSAADNQVFLDFLSQLRRYYIDRNHAPTFWSVILAGVYDIKNIQYKIMPDAHHKANSPWNIAADFLIDMSFSAEDISGMLLEYEQDYKTGMDIPAIAENIYNYTSGYPYLVSRICKSIDERVTGSEAFPERADAWTNAGISESVKILLAEKILYLRQSREN